MRAGIKFCKKTCHKPRIAPHKCNPLYDKCPGFSSCGILRYHPEERDRRKNIQKEAKLKEDAERKAEQAKAKAIKAARNKIPSVPGEA